MSEGNATTYHIPWDRWDMDIPHPNDREPEPVLCSCGVEIGGESHREKQMWLGMHITAAERRGHTTKHGEVPF